jgi:hypothetical protein
VNTGRKVFSSLSLKQYLEESLYPIMSCPKTDNLRGDERENPNRRVECFNTL